MAGVGPRREQGTGGPSCEAQARAHAHAGLSPASGRLPPPHWGEQSPWGWITEDQRSPVSTCPLKTSVPSRDGMQSPP